MDQDTQRTDRQKKFDVVLEAIKTQPFGMHTEDGDEFNPEKLYPEDTLSEFVDNTWISGVADNLFEHVTNRVLDALETSFPLLGNQEVKYQELLTRAETQISLGRSTGSHTGSKFNIYQIAEELVAALKAKDSK